MDNYNEKICLERHKRVDETLDLHNRRLNAHSGEIDMLKEAKTKSSTEITNLCKSLDSLNGRLDKIVAQNSAMQKIFITALIGFFFFVLEKQLFPTITTIIK